MSNEREDIIQINSLSKSFGSVKAVSNISLKVKKGEVFGFLGPNGAGKTTTIRLLLNQIYPDSGNFRILDSSSDRYDPTIMQRIGYVSGEGYLIENYTPRKLFQYLAGFYPQSGDFEPLAQRLKLQLDRQIKQLSSGNKQKVLLVQAFMKNPELLILDEPTSGLDPLLQNEFYSMVEQFKESGGTVFLSSHLLSEVQRLCDRVGIIKDGEIIKVSSVDELVSQGHKVLMKMSEKAYQQLQKLFPNQVTVQQKGEYSMLYSGDVNSLIKKLSEVELLSLQITEPSLEELFLELYK